jgi:hypothetical protein
MHDLLGWCSWGTVEEQGSGANAWTAAAACLEALGKFLKC